MQSNTVISEPVRLGTLGASCPRGCRTSLRGFSVQIQVHKPLGSSCPAEPADTRRCLMAQKGVFSRLVSERAFEPWSWVQHEPGTAAPAARAQLSPRPCVAWSLFLFAKLSSKSRLRQLQSPSKSPERQIERWEAGTSPGPIPEPPRGMANCPRHTLTHGKCQRLDF